MTSLATLRRRKAQAVVVLAAKERRHRGGVAKARADAIAATLTLFCGPNSTTPAPHLCCGRRQGATTPPTFSSPEPDMSINRAILVGNVGSDPEIRATQSGDKVATFRIATSETWKDKQSGERKEATEWHTIVCFNQNIVPVIEAYVVKGSKVGIEGSIKTRKWQDRDNNDRYSTEIVIGRFDGRLSLEGQPSGAKRDEHGYGETRAKPAQDYGAAKSGAPAQPSGRPHLDDDIPF